MERKEKRVGKEEKEEWTKCQKFRKSDYLARFSPAKKYVKYLKEISYEIKLWGQSYHMLV